VVEAQIAKAVFHWYTGTSSVLRDIIDRACFISATPAVEYHEEHRRAVKEIPLDRLLLETDSPVVYRRGSEFEFESRPADVIRSLQGAAALRTARLRDQVQRSLTDTRVRFEVSQALAGARTEEEVLDVLIRQMDLYPKAMAMIFFVMWVVWALQSNGVAGFLAHLFGVKGDTTGLLRMLMVVVFFLVGLIEVVSICLRPVSLSFRLFGNIYAGENMLEAMATLIHNRPGLRLWPASSFPSPSTFWNCSSASFRRWFSCCFFRLLLSRTLLGKALRACAINRRAAGIVGITSEPCRF
jgi:hypothetical protein